LSRDFTEVNLGLLPASDWGDVDGLRHGVTSLTGTGPVCQAVLDDIVPTPTRPHARTTSHEARAVQVARGAAPHTDGNLQPPLQSQRGLASRRLMHSE
jgi:hypothetical protein